MSSRLKLMRDKTNRPKVFSTSLALRSLTSTGSSSWRSTFATRSFSSSSTTTCLSWSRWGWHRHCWLEENHQPGRIHERGNRVGHGWLWNGLAGGGTLIIFDYKLWFFRIASTCLRDRWECSASWRRNLYFQRSSFTLNTASPSPHNQRYCDNPMAGNG